MEAVEPLKKKNRRKITRKNNIVNKKFRCVGVNAAGILSKLGSLDVILKTLEPSVFSMQETKVYKPGKIKTDYSVKYTIYELHRQKSRGGGICIGILNEMQPTWIAEGDDESEYLVVGLTLEKFKVRIISGYGPQVCDSIERKNKFWSDIDHQVKEAGVNDEAVLLQMDSNAWLGNTIIKDDKNPMNSNGKLFKEFYSKNPNLHLVNGTSVCRGTITRQRKTEKRDEESILDLFLVCDKLKPFVKEMVIDEERNFPLVTKSNKASDHFTTYIDMSLKFFPKRDERKELFNFRNTDCQEAFRNLTEKTNELSKWFYTEEMIEVQCENWFESLNNCFKNSFQKIRVNKKVKESEVTTLLAKKFELINEQKKNVGNNIELQKKIDAIEERLIELTAKKNRDKVVENFKSLDGSKDSFTSGVWQIKKKIFPKHKPELPAAKLDINGKLITSHTELKKLYLDTFTHRLRERPIKKGFEEIQKLKEELCEKRLKISKHNKSVDWEMKDLEKALTRLKANKARDPLGIANEVFKNKVAGQDLKKSLLIMMNKMKRETFLPEFAKLKNISAIWKRKGSKLQLSDHRGIIVGSIFNNILMSMIYGSKYDIIDENMSDAQIGSRRNKSVRNHIWVLGGIVNEAIKDKKVKVDIIVSDYKEAFDSLWLEDIVIDLFDSGVQDDHLNMIHKADSSSLVSVNTPVGQTEVKEVKNSILQGECLGPVKCSNSVDKICRKCEEINMNLYKYRNEVKIGPLGMVDDIIAVTNCGTDSVEMNSYLNTQTNIKQVRETQLAS